MSAEDIERALLRIAHEVVERNRGCRDLVLVGVRTLGVPLARRLQDHIATAYPSDDRPPLGAVDITLYRDDAPMGLPDPVVGRTEIPFRLTGKSVLLVDDVLYTGRTVRAAIDALIDLGRPRRIELAVLVDRGHRELPIRADYVGRSVETAPDQSVKVHLEGKDGEDRVVVRRLADGHSL
jgi:pyrimidine operon attenuation protein/uracil phosphoribosyltransferase